MREKEVNQIISWRLSLYTDYPGKFAKRASKRPIPLRIPISKPYRQGHEVRIGTPLLGSLSMHDWMSGFKMSLSSKTVGCADVRRIQLFAKVPLREVSSVVGGVTYNDH